MKQKLVINVDIHDYKMQTKILKIAVSLPGVQSATLLQETNQIEVVGDGVDPVFLTILLRKRLARRNCLGKRIAAYAEIYSVNPVSGSRGTSSRGSSGGSSSHSIGATPELQGGRVFEPYHYVPVCVLDEPYPPPPCSIL